MADNPNFYNNIAVKIIAVFFFGIIAFLINFICYIFVLDLFKNSIGWILLPLIYFFTLAVMPFIESKNKKSTYITILSIFLLMILLLLYIF